MEVTHIVQTNEKNDTTDIEKSEVANFLFKHLEQYGDELQYIRKAIDYIFDLNGGSMVIQKTDNQISGAVIINKTNPAETHQHKQHDPDIFIFQVGPQQSA